MSSTWDFSQTQWRSITVYRSMFFFDCYRLRIEKKTKSFTNREKKNRELFETNTTTTETVTIERFSHQIGNFRWNLSTKKKKKELHIKVLLTVEAWHAKDEIILVSKIFVDVWKLKCSWNWTQLSCRFSMENWNLLTIAKLKQTWSYKNAKLFWNS